MTVTLMLNVSTPGNAINVGVNQDLQEMARIVKVRKLLLEYQ